MIVIENLSKRYHTKSGYRWVLNNASMTIRRGQSVGIMGRNGAGKSTFLRMIAGIEMPTSGTVRREMSCSWPLGFSGGFQSSLTGAENTRFVARLYGVPLEETLEKVKEFSELGEYFLMPLRTYSSGMAARLAFAVSLAVDFECYLIDEITAVGDARFRARCSAALKKRSQKGSMIMVSHDVNTLRSYCESAVVLNQGKLDFYNNMDEAAKAYASL